MRRRDFIIVVISGAAALWPSMARAQTSQHRKVASGDIVSGQVPDGQIVETEGYLWVSGTGVFLNVAATSDQPPLFVDVVGVPLDMLAKVKAACLAERPSPTAGCQAVVRGRVGNRGNRNVRGIFATYIAPQ
jgi:hypothetical protein